MDLDDFRRQMIEVKELGPVRHLMRKIPGLSPSAFDSRGVDADREIGHMLAIIYVKHDGFWLRLKVDTPDPKGTFRGFGLPIVDMSHGKFQF